MWLLSTDRAELHWFTDHTKIPAGGYALLSHTWEGEEQTFQDTVVLKQKCKSLGKNPRDLASLKVRNCCVLAERDGYRWVWIDSCCIDKTSSTELSEAINSMFNWYSCAEVCYAYFSDVPSDCVLDAPGSAFRTARWHTRGWTLQELLAPSLVVFLSQDWKCIGTKRSLASLLTEIVPIRLDVLMHTTSVFVTSVAERMFWASRRQTTRVEDEAYCLLGLFNINMPTIYGEGRRAFQRLQQEIAKEYIDTSLFGWGAVHQMEGVGPVPLSEMWSYGYGPSRLDRYLFAPSPHFFYNAVVYTPEMLGGIQPYTRWQRKQLGLPEEGPSDPTFGRSELPAFEMTSYGMKCRFPVADLGDFSVAILLWQIQDQHFGLILHPTPDYEPHDPTRRRYYTSYALRHIGGTPDTPSRNSRLVPLGKDLYDLRCMGQHIQAEWRDIYIHAAPSQRYSSRFVHNLSRLQLRDPTISPFRFPPWVSGSLEAIGLRHTGSSDVQQETVGEREVQWVMTGFANSSTGEVIDVAFGTCTDRSVDAEPAPWAWAQTYSLQGTTPPPARQGSHDCAKDHIDSWPDRSCEFGEDERRVRLLFRPCSHNPGTLVVHMELEGKVYDDMRREMGDTKIVSRATGNGYRYEFKEVSTHVTYLPVVCSVLLGMTVTSIAYLRFTSTPRA